MKPNLQQYLEQDNIKIIQTVAMNLQINQQ